MDSPIPRAAGPWASSKRLGSDGDDRIIAKSSLRWWRGSPHRVGTHPVLDLGLDHRLGRLMSCPPSWATALILSEAVHPGVFPHTAPSGVAPYATRCRVS